MAFLRGDRAKVLVEEVIGALLPHTPAEVASIKVRTTGAGGLIIRAMPEGADEDARLQSWGGTYNEGSQPYPRFDPEASWQGSDSLSWGGTPDYIGTWLPLLPSTALARINAQSATECVQDAVEALVQEPWPYPDSHVKTRRVGPRVRVWFHDGSGGRVRYPFEVPAVVTRRF